MISRSHSDHLFGAVKVDNVPSVNQEVLLIAERGERFIDSTTTDNRGHFEFLLPKHYDQEKTIIMAKIKNDVISLASEIVSIPQEKPLLINVNTSKDFITIHLKIESSEGYPKYLNVFLDPIRVSSIPSGLMHFANQQKESVFDSHFIYAPMKSRTFTIKVKSGIYRIGGEYINYDRPMIVNPDFSNYVVSRVSIDSEIDLGGSPSSGFIFEAEKDCTLVMVLRVLDDEEIS